MVQEALINRQGRQLCPISGAETPDLVWDTDVEVENAMANMQIDTNFTTTNMVEQDLREIGETHRLEASWEPAPLRSVTPTPKEPTSRSSPPTAKRKRYKSHRSKKVRETKVEAEVEYDTYVKLTHENEVEMMFQVDEVDMDNDMKFQVPVSVDEPTYQLSKLCLNDMTHEYEEEVDTVVSQLGKLKIMSPPEHNDPLNIIDKFQEMEVLKLFQI